ncbi:MAG: DUF932 domain-containing protein [Candidatus Latescibacteria bacterium]|jgi:hypothetical protein|nr:DUF932 domain-containing protein [Candidatus Latescibacterota bacterium]
MTNIEILSPTEQVVPLPTTPSRWMDHDDQEVFFPVSSIPVIDATQEPTGYHRIHRQDTDKTLAVLKTKYTLTPYSTKIDILDDAIQDSSLDKEGMERRLVTTHEGRKLFCAYDFPTEYQSISDVDGANLSINMWDSYDGSTSLIVKAGCYRAKCSNGLLIGDTISGVHKRHMGEFDPSEIIDGIMVAIETWHKHKTDLDRWARTSLKESDANIALRQFTDTQSLQDRLFALFRAEADYSSTATVWNLVNALSYWATHTKSRTEGNAAHTQKERQLKVLAFQNTDAFQDLMYR